MVTRAQDRSVFSRVLSSSISLAFISVGFMLPGLVRTKMASISLSTEGLATVGQLSQTQTLLISLGAAGVVTAARVILARNDVGGDELRGTQNWLLIVPTGLAVLLAGLAVCFNSSLARIILGSDAAGQLIVAAAVGIPAAVLAQLTLAVAQVKSSRAQLAIAGVASACVGSASVVILLIPGSMDFAAWSFVAAPVVQLLVISLMCREARVSFRHRPRIGTARLREVVMLGWSSASLGVFASGAELAGRTVVVHEHGIASLAFYQPVVLIVTQLVGMILSAVATSSLLETASTSDRQHLGQQLTEIVRKLTPIIAAGLAFISAIAPILILVFFDAEIAREAKENVQVALAGELPRAYAWILGSCLLPQRLRRQWLLNGMVTVAAQLVVGVALGYVYGISGLIAGLLVGNVVSAVLTHIILRRAGIFIGCVNLVAVLGIGTAIASTSFFSNDGVINYAALILGVSLLLLQQITHLLERRANFKGTVSR